MSSGSTRSHLLDLVFFRTLGVGTLIHEVAVTPQAETPVIVGALCLFFMPDWLRGRNSLPMQLLQAWANRQP